MKHLFGSVIALLLVAFAILIILVVPKRLDAGDGVIRVPFYKRTATMDAAREMISDLGWQHKSEGGDGKQVTFRATDRNGKALSFKFQHHIVGMRVVVSTEETPQYSVEEITTELARRIGMHVGGRPLPIVVNKVPTSR